MAAPVPGLVVLAVVVGGVVLALLTFALPIQVSAWFDRFAVYRDDALDAVLPDVEDD